MQFKTQSMIDDNALKCVSKFTDKVSTVVDVLIGAKATQSCFPVSGPTSHLKMTRPPGFFFFFSETKVERK